MTDKGMRIAQPLDNHAHLSLITVNFRVVDFGSAFFNWSCCVLCVLSYLGFEMHDVHFLCQRS